MRTRAFAVILTVVFVVFSAGEASAGWNPLKDIAKGAGSVVKGVGGIFGGGVAGLAGPTIDEAKSAAQQVVSSAIAQAQAAAQVLLADVNQSVEARIKQANRP